jgi:hypothetical protein
MAEQREAFVRWQRATIEQFTIATSVLLGIAVAALGYMSTELLDEKVMQVSRTQLASVACFSVSAGAGLLLVISRLLDFRSTTQLVKKRRESALDVKSLKAQTVLLGNLSWGLFWVQVGTLFIGVKLFAVHLLAAIMPKLQ